MNKYRKKLYYEAKKIIFKRYKEEFGKLDPDEYEAVDDVIDFGLKMIKNYFVDISFDFESTLLGNAHYYATKCLPLKAIQKRLAEEKGDDVSYDGLRMRFKRAEPIALKLFKERVEQGIREVFKLPQTEN